MIVVAGESLVDLLVRPDGRVGAVPGGGPFNVARALARLGTDVAFVGRISTDRFGTILHDRLEDDGVDLRWVRRTDDPTLLAVAELDDTGAATYRFHSAGTAAVGLVGADLPPLPADIDALHVGTLGLVFEPMATTIEGIVAGVDPATLVMLDPNVRPAAILDEAAYRARLDRILARADVVTASVEDLRWLRPAREPDGTAEDLLELGPAAVLVTDGPRAVTIVSLAGRRTIHPPLVDVVDTVGAGDAFGAGFLAAWTGARRTRDDLVDLDALGSATAFAARVAAVTATRVGAEPPTRLELGVVEARA
jgi:fructokinase